MHRDMREIRCEQAGESCLIVKHPSGLEIRIMEMPGFHTAHALFGTRYGSINNRFRLKGDAEYTQVPDGIAHFLEPRPVPTPMPTHPSTAPATCSAARRISQNPLRSC